MSDTEPALNWADAPEHFRAAHERLKSKLTETEGKLPEVEALKRQNAFLRAGVDPEHPAFPFFDAGYNGKLDTEEIRSSWETLSGGATAQAPATATAQTDNDGANPEIAAALQQLQQDRATLTTDATAPGEEPSPDPQREAIRIFHQRQAEGANRDQAAAAGFGHIFEAANAGDPRIVSDSAEEAQRKWMQRNGFA